MARRGQAAALGGALLLAGVAGGWGLRYRYDLDSARQIAEDALALDLLTDPAHAGDVYIQHTDGTQTHVDHEADLRCTLHDPEAIVLPARVSAVSDRGGGGVELQLGTAKGTFRARWEGSVIPPVGRACELFGRIAPAGQTAGAPTLLAPASLEPVGTMARLRGSREPR
jgi:hypothetical protein